MPQYTNPFYYDVTPAKDEHVYISIQQMEESFLFETLPDAEKFISECESNSGIMHCIIIQFFAF